MRHFTGPLLAVSLIRHVPELLSPPLMRQPLTVKMPGACLGVADPLGVREGVFETVGRAEGLPRPGVGSSGPEGSAGCGAADVIAPGVDAREAVGSQEYAATRPVAATATPAAIPVAISARRLRRCLVKSSRVACGDAAARAPACMTSEVESGSWRPNRPSRTCRAVGRSAGSLLRHC